MLELFSSSLMAVMAVGNLLMPIQPLAFNNDTVLQANAFFNATPIPPEAPISVPIPEEIHLTIPELIKHLGSDFGATTTEIALAINQAENPDGDKCNRELGCKGGIGTMMLTASTFKENCKGDVYDAETNILCGLKLINRNELWRWEMSMYDMPKHKGWLGRLATSTRAYVNSKMKYCSCVVYVAQRIDLPPIKNFFGLNSNTMPVIGSVALLNYNGIAHGGVIRNITDKGIYIDDANFKRCQEMKNRFISWEDMKKWSRGFWKPLE